MSFSIFITQPKIGKELQNIQDIISQLSVLNTEEVFGLIISNSGIMGINAFAYTSLYDFNIRQELAIKKLQSCLNEQQWIIGSKIIVENHQPIYQPILIQQDHISIGSIFSISTPKGQLKIGVIAHHLEQIKLEQNLDAIILLEEFPFETGFKNFPEKISLSGRRIISEDRLSSVLLELEKVYNTPVINIPTIGQNNGVIWDGTLGLGYTGKVRFSYFNKNPLFTVHLAFNLSISPISKRSSATIEHIFHTLCFHIKNYLFDVNLKKVIVAISGGIDSALVAALAVKALGKDNVLGLLMPGPFSSEHSVSDAVKLCDNLGIEYKIHSITAIYQSFLDLNEHELEQSLTLENLQARIRGTLLMAYSNEKNAFALNTCNKSEDIVGYATLYGDAVGAFAPVGDLYKQEIYELAEYFNTREYKEVIPKNILIKAPSAELKEDQKDIDTLPEYFKLDLFLYAYLEAVENPYTIAQKIGLDNNQVDGILKKIFRSEYKRKQSPVVLNISHTQNMLNSRTLAQNQNWF